MIDDKTLDELEKVTRGGPNGIHIDRMLLHQLVDEIRRLKAVLRQIGSTENWNPAFVSKMAREAVDKEEGGA